jgi:hypothetical protein
MTPLTYVLYGASWFVLGVVVGAEWTRMRRDVRRIANAQAGEETVVQHETANDEATRPRRRWTRRVLDAFVVLLFVGSAVQAYITYDRIEEVVACQKAYQSGFADALDARKEPAAVERAALIQWMTTLDQLITKTQPGVDVVAARQKFAAATSEYLQKQAELTRKQQENPYPPSPRDVCG